MHRLDRLCSHLLIRGLHADVDAYVWPGKFYTLTTGANEKRWGKIKPRLEEVVKSFEVVQRYD